MNKLHPHGNGARVASFRSQDRTLGEAFSARGAYPLSDRPFYGRGAIRPARAMEEATWPCPDGLRQSAGGSSFDGARPGHGPAGMAVSARRAKAERHSAAPSGPGGGFERPDLAGVVDSFPRAPPENAFADLPPDNRVGGCRCDRADRASGWLFEWSQRPRIELPIPGPRCREKIFPAAGIKCRFLQLSTVAAQERTICPTRNRILSIRNYRISTTMA